MSTNNFELSFPNYGPQNIVHSQWSVRVPQFLSLSLLPHLIICVFAKIFLLQPDRIALS